MRDIMQITQTSKHIPAWIGTEKITLQVSMDTQAELWWHDLYLYGGGQYFSGVNRTQLGYAEIVAGNAHYQRGGGGTSYTCECPNILNTFTIKLVS